MKSHGFILALLAAILFAYFFPVVPPEIPLKQVIDIGIGLIFFFYGLKLSPAELKLGFFNYPVHILVQLSTFVLFPLLTFLFIPLFPDGITSDLWLAVFFLGALPSTVSSSVVMVALAKGNLPSAIFNASISGIIGIVATPLWLGLFLTKTGDFQFFDVITKLFLQIVLPLIIGLLLQRFLGAFARRHGKRLALFDKSVIVLIVYSSFGNSFESGIFQTVPSLELLKIAAIVTLLFFMVYGLTGYLSRIFGFKKEDRITAKFCGTKKSLVHGSVMVKIIFGNSAVLGLFLLPVMLYHILQLILVAFFAEKYRRQQLKEETV